MSDNNKCGDCVHKDGCKAAYSKLGQYKGPNVAPRVCIAFLIPLIVFISLLEVLPSIFDDLIKNESLRGFAIIITSALVAFISAVMAEALYKIIWKNRNSNLERSEKLTRKES